MVNFYKKIVKQFQDQKFWKSGFQAFFIRKLKLLPFLKGSSQYPFLNFLKQIIIKDSKLG